MKLGLWVPIVDEKPGGLGVYIAEICARITRIFPDHIFFTLEDTKIPESWGVKTVVRLKGPPVSTSLARLPFRFFALNFLLPQALKEHDCDALFVPFHEGMTLPPIRQIIVIHDLTMLSHPSKYFSPLLRAYAQFALPIVLNSCESVICVSENTAIDVLKHSGVKQNRLKVVGEGYDRETYRTRSKDDLDRILAPLDLPPRYLLYSGTLAPHKNTPFLADILALARHWGLDLELVLTGRLDAGAFEPTRRRLVSRGMWNHTRLQGYVEREQLSGMMQRATAFVFPSLNEGFGLAPLEAMASGAAVLCSNRTSLPEVVGTGGLLLDPSDPQNWVDQLLRISTEPDFDRQLRESAQISASRYRWDAAADKIADIVRGDS